MLAPDELRVYWLVTSCTDAELARCFAMLSAEERERAGRFAREEPRREFVVTRAALRMLLGRVLGLEASAVPITVRANGKPETPGCAFNVSHARGLTVVALAGSGAVGVDVEPWDDAVECMDVARTAFSADDVRRLEAVSEDERLRAFFEIWTRREAIAKYFGVGISDPAALRGELPQAGVRVEMLRVGDRVSAAVATSDSVTLSVCKEISVPLLLQ